MREISSPYEERYTVGMLTESQFFEMQKEWNELLNNSKANTLFLTWEWQSLWWKTWATEYALSLNIITVRNSNGTLVGIAPLYSHNCYVAKIIPCKQLLLIGNSAKIGPSIRSEFLDFIVHINDSERIISIILSAINDDKSWGKIILGDIITQSETFAAITNKNSFVRRTYTRSILKDTGIRIDTTKNTSTYIESLGKSVRRSYFSRRNRISNTSELSTYTNQESAESSLALLNSFHVLRWGRPCFDEFASKFHKQLCTVSPMVIRPDISTVKIDSDYTSVIYNVDYNRMRYNLQLGFKPINDKKISTGHIQLGFSLESSFAASNIDSFDLLAGNGKNTFYKEKLSGKAYRLFTIEIVSHRLLRLLYILNDSIYRKLALLLGQK
jgi:hypothetical protein